MTTNEGFVAPTAEDGGDGPAVSSEASADASARRRRAARKEPRPAKEARVSRRERRRAEQAVTLGAPVEQVEVAPTLETVPVVVEQDGGEIARAVAPGAPAPSWWHRAHPVFTPLSGFYTGLAVVIILPAIYGAVLSALVSENTAEDLVPFALVVFAIPLVLICLPRTRRFGRYMLLGMVLTAIVVLAVAALTVFVLLKNDG